MAEMTMFLLLDAARRDAILNNKLLTYRDQVWCVTHVDAHAAQTDCTSE